ncbi:MAG TPA: hypothetical protein VJM49_20140, partial [Acidimicrobiales bacterium]|nr:hypothetical protein [Acidimicrobiales bacterium]
EGLTAGLARLLGDPDLRTRMAADARARAERLTWAAAAASLLQVLVDDADRRSLSPADRRRGGRRRRLR